MPEEIKKVTQATPVKREPAKLPPKDTGADEANIKPAKEDPKKLEFMKRKLIEVGMPADSVDVFTTIEQCEAVLNSMRAKGAIQKVDSIEEKPNPAEEKQIERMWQSKADIMMDKWLGEFDRGEVTQMLVPLEANKKAGIVSWARDKRGRRVQVVREGTEAELIQVNGARWYVPMGVLVKIPNSVADELSKRLRLTNEAGQEFLIDRQDPETGKPVSESL